MNLKWPFRVDHAALLVIDMQNDFILPGSPLETPEARNRLLIVKNLIEKCRDAKIPIMYTRHVHLPDVSDSPLELAYFPILRERGLRENDPGSEIHEQVKPLLSDIVIKKHRYDAFYKTDLEKLLRDLKKDTVIISGTVTNICCESTARSAFMRDFKVVFLSDATAGFDEESHNATLKIINLAFGRVITCDELFHHFDRFG